MELFILACIIGLIGGIVSGIRNIKNPKPPNPEMQKLKDGAKVGAAIIGITGYSIMKELNKPDKTNCRQ
jgi:hypothetical protein